MSLLSAILCLLVVFYGAMKGRFSDGVGWGLLCFMASVAVDVVALVLAFFGAFAAPNGGAGTAGILAVGWLAYLVISLSVSLLGPAYAISCIAGYDKAPVQSPRRTKGPRRIACPACAERVVASAKVCRFCGHDLVAGDDPA